MFGWLGGWWLRLIYREKTTQGSLLLPLASPSIAAGGGGCTTKFNAICKMKSIQLIVDFDKHTSTSACTTLAEPAQLAPQLLITAAQNCRCTAAVLGP